MDAPGLPAISETHTPTHMQAHKNQQNKIYICHSPREMGEGWKNTVIMKTFSTCASFSPFYLLSSSFLSLRFYLTMYLYLSSTPPPPHPTHTHTPPLAWLTASLHSFSPIKTQTHVHENARCTCRRRPPHTHRYTGPHPDVKFILLSERATMSLSVMDKSLSTRVSLRVLCVCFLSRPRWISCNFLTWMSEWKSLMNNSE